MKMSHPDAKAPVEVVDAQVEMYRSQGWTEAEPEPTTSATTAATIKGGK